MIQEMSNTNNKIVVFLDAVGRTIIGSLSRDEGGILAVENPALVHIQPSPQNNQLQLQILPLFFREFQEDKSKSSVWNYNKSTITIADDINLSPQFVAQYQQIFQTAPSQPQQEPKTVKLFDEE